MCFSDKNVLINMTDFVMRAKDKVTTDDVLNEQKIDNLQ